jgi:hypothetical protein
MIHKVEPLVDELLGHDEALDNDGSKVM